MSSNKVTEHGTSPLLTAARNGHLDVVRLLCEALLLLLLLLL